MFGTSENANNVKRLLMVKMPHFIIKKTKRLRFAFYYSKKKAKYSTISEWSFYLFKRHLQI